jgi:hypothetical protein
LFTGPRAKRLYDAAHSASGVNGEAGPCHVLTLSLNFSRPKSQRWQTTPLQKATRFASSLRLSLGRPAPSSPTAATSPEAVAPETFRARREVFEKLNYMHLIRYGLVPLPGRGLHSDAGQHLPPHAPKFIPFGPTLAPRNTNFCDQ